jgi:hypothetical protein
MDRLQISAEERPKPQPKLKTAAAASSSPRAPEIQFDPFKAIVMSTAPQVCQYVPLLRCSSIFFYSLPGIVYYGVCM